MRLTAHRLQRPHDGVDVLVVAGEIDIFTARRLRADLDDVVRRGSRDVVVDMSATRTIDTHGLAALLNAARRVEARGRTFTVVCDGAVRRAMEVTGVARQLRLTPVSDPPHADAACA